MSRILLLLLVDIQWVELVIINAKKIGPVLIFTGYENTYMHKAKININKR